MAKKYLDDNGLLYFWQKLKTTFALISHTHTKSEITDFPTSMTPTSHTHGNITNAGALQSTDVAVATGDKIVITDASNSNKVARASLSFDTATSGADKKALTQAGTWVTFLTSADVPEGASASSTTPKMDGTASVGTETAFARGDHVHPSDTSRVPTTRTVNGHALSSNVTVTASDVGLGNVTDGAQVNVLEGVQMNGTDLTITSKKVNIPTFGTRPVTGESGSLGLVPTPTRQAFNLTQVLTDTMGWAEVNLYTEVKSSGTDIGKRAMVLHMYGSNSNSAVYAIIPDATTSETGLMSSTDKTKLDSITMTDGIIDSSVLPSFVDDVIEAYARTNQTELGSTWLATGSATGTVITPETGKIYVLMNDSTSYSANSQFRWGGTAYVKLNDGGVTAITNSEIDTIVAS